MTGDADRRQLADLPGVLRPADRPGHRQSGQVTNAVFGFTSMLHQPGARPPARPHRRRLRPARADVPPRGGRHLQGQPRGGARHPAPADGPGPPGGRDAAASRSSSRPASRPTTSSPRWPPTAATEATTCIIVTGDRDSYQLVEDPHIKVLYNKRGVSRLRALRRGRHPRAHRRHARPVRRSTPRCGAIRPTTCPACPGVGEKTAAKLINTYGGLDGIFEPRRRADAQAAREPRRARGPGPHATPR